jgi:dihydrofolate reductase
VELTVTMFTTLDGVAQAPGGADEDRDGGFEHGGWMIPHVDEEFGKAMDAWFSRADAFLFGRRTYEIFLGHWPKVTDPDDPVASRFNALPKYVPTRTLDHAEWDGTTLLKGEAAQEIAEIKKQPGRELQVHGSVNLVQTLNREGLVDEYRVLVFPVLLGTGKRLFEEVTPTALELADSKTSSTGAMLQTYRPAGAPVYEDAPPPK